MPKSPTRHSRSQNQGLTNHHRSQQCSHRCQTSSSTFNNPCPTDQLHQPLHRLVSPEIRHHESGLWPVMLNLEATVIHHHLECQCDQTLNQGHQHMAILQPLQDDNSMSSKETSTRGCKSGTRPIQLINKHLRVSFHPEERADQNRNIAPPATVILLMET